MKSKILKPFLAFYVLAVMALVGFVLAAPPPTDAQCGSSASSCKSCHETQGEYPVNTSGEWHTQHAFGDFCEFCHAGNVQAKEKDAAHQGLVDPMGDVAASCQGCHPQDLDERSQIYASTLGIDLSTPSSGGDDSGSDGGDSAAADDGSCVAAPLGGEEIDSNLLYIENISPSSLINWGNVILVLMIGGVLGVFAVLAWSWEGWGPKVAGWINRNVKVVSDAALEANASVKAEGVPSSAELQDLFERKPQLKELWPKLSQSDSTTLNDLDRILSDDQAPNLLHSLSQLKAK
jgi:hypothetical protein